MVVTCVAALCGCGRVLRDSPDRAYREARLNFEHGDLASASEIADQGLRHANKDSERAWRFRVLQAEIFTWRGLSNDALSLTAAPVPANLRESDAAVRKELVEGLADCYLRRFDEASAHLGEAERLAEAQQQSLLGEVYLGRGTLEILQGNPSPAQSFFRQSLQAAQENDQPFLEARALGSLGFVAMRQSRFDESIDWYTESLRLSRSLGARIVTEKTLGNMGWSYFQMGDFDTALSLTSEARAAAHELDVNKDEPIWFRNIGTIEYAQRTYGAAERDYEAGLSLARKLDSQGVVADCLNNLAHIELKRGNSEEAERYNLEALNLERQEGNRPLELYSLVTEAYIAASKNDFARAETDLAEVSRESASDQYLRWQTEAAFASVFAAANQFAAADKHYRKWLVAVEAAHSSIERLDFRFASLSGAIDYYEAYVSFLVSRNELAEALEVAELSRARTLANGLGFSSSELGFPIEGFNPRQTAKQLNAIILTYWLGADHSYLWVNTPERLASFTLPPAAVIDPLVQAYRQALLGSRDVLETRNAAGQKLYDLLIAPAAKLIPPGSRVTILPDGSLYNLNFETLLAPAPQLHYWIEDVDISYANSLTLLAAGAARHASPAKKLLLVGDAVSPDTEFPKLPQAAAEMSGIENHFSELERKVLTGAAATPESYFDSQPQDFSYIHFVAHGTASRTSPLDSAVILSKQGDNYKLYARDIIQHPLHADLVTISACHGEGVRTYSGEGLVGLSWAFLHAGAHGVIAALWEVNDNSTPQLMDHLYSEISKGVPPAVALRDAKLALLHSGTVYRRPFYWAPFQFYRGA